MSMSSDEISDWPTIVVDIPGFSISTFDFLIGAAFGGISYPSCPECEFQIKRTLCSIVSLLFLLFQTEY
jgi:hypothetical protein